MPKSLPLSALGIMLFCNVAWAMNVVVSKIAVSTLGLPPLFYTVLRSAVVPCRSTALPARSRTPPSGESEITCKK